MAKSEGSSGNAFDEKRLERLVELMKAHDLKEIELREQEQEIRIARNVPEGVPAFGPPTYANPQYASPAPQAPPTPQASGTPAPPADEPEGDNIVFINSPMVGTFYARPNPNSPAFVKVGDHVEAETTVCIVEAMKVFNEIPAEVRGKIVAVLVDDEEPVEFGKPLFKVDTKG